MIRLVDANESAGGGVTWDGVQLWAIPVEVYRFSIDTQDGSLAGLFSYIPSEGLVGASIPYEATLEITEASGVFAFFGALDWGDDGGVTAYEEEGQFYVSIGAPTNAGYIEIAIDEEFDLGGSLPVAALSAEKTRVYGGGELIFSGSEPGASVTLTYAPEPGAAAGAGGAGGAGRQRARAPQGVAPVPPFDRPAPRSGAGRRIQLVVGHTTIHSTPKRSATMPKLDAKKVFASGMRTVPPSASAAKHRAASASSATWSASAGLPKVAWPLHWPSEAISLVSPITSSACRIFRSEPGGSMACCCSRSGLSSKRILISTVAPSALR